MPTVDARRARPGPRCAGVLAVALVTLIPVVVGSFMLYRSVNHEGVGVGVAGIAVAMGALIVATLVMLAITGDESGATATAWALMLVGVVLLFATSAPAYAVWFADRVPATVTALDPCEVGECVDRLRFADGSGRDLGWAMACGEPPAVGGREEVFVDPLGLVAPQRPSCAASGWVLAVPFVALLLYAVGPLVLIARQLMGLAPPAA